MKIADCTAWLEGNQGLGSAMIEEVMSSVEFYNVVFKRTNGEFIRYVTVEFTEIDLARTGMSKLRYLCEKYDFQMVTDAESNKGIATKSVWTFTYALRLGLVKIQEKIIYCPTITGQQVQTRVS